MLRRRVRPGTLARFLGHGRELGLARVDAFRAMAIQWKDGKAKAVAVAVERADAPGTRL
jgi:hypothetical protein